MKLLWAIDKNEMKARHILFQDEDKDHVHREFAVKIASNRKSSDVMPEWKRLMVFLGVLIVI